MGVVQRTAPLRLAGTPDRVTVLAAAISGVAADPGSAEAGRRLDEAVAGCTGEEYEAAWGLASEAAPAEPEPVPEPAAASPRGHLLRDVLSALRAVNGDTVITWAMTLNVAVVVVDAAIVSYSHIYDLATGAPGSGTETGIQPHLLPLSIDGVIAEASLVMLYAARHKLKAPRLARFMLSLGIAATVAANVVHGLPSSLLPPVAHVVISALLSAWPAGAFIGSVELSMQLVRATHDVAEDADTGRGSARTRRTTRRTKPRTTTPRTRTSPRTAPRTKPRADPPPAEPAKTGTAPDRVTAAIRQNPLWGDDKIAAECGVHPRTVKRRRDKLALAAANP
jgi:hypothetical protein